MFAKQQQSASHDFAELCGSEGLKVNVIFTDPEGTLAALRTAGKLADDLGARINLIAVQAVPIRLPMSQPQVSVDFSKQMLSQLILRAAAQGSAETTAHLYLCRDKERALLQVLKPNSLVIVGGSNHWWSTANNRLARRLRSKGHQVVFIGC
jgi:hypothetical protein